MPGTKRKIPMEKRETKEQRAVAFSKRRKGLFKKAADLCVLHNARVAVLATPPSDKSTAVFSFGHTSVDEVVDAFLHGHHPNPTVGSSSWSIPRDPSVKQGDCLRNKKPRLGFWWEQEGFENCEDPKELREYIERLKKLKENVMIRLKNKRDAQIVSLGLHPALTIQETDGSHQNLWGTKNNNQGSSSALTIQETEENGGSHANLWESKNNNLGNDDFGNGLRLDDLEQPGSSSWDEDEEDHFAEILESWCRENNIIIEQSTGSDEHCGFSTFSQFLN